MTKNTALISIRWVIALTLIAKGALMLVRAAGSSGGGFAGAAAFGLIAFALIILGVLMVSRDFVPWVSAPLWRFITGIIFPDEKFDHPPANYALPRSYRERRRPEDAIAEYLKIMQHHPQELAAYVECLEVMMENGDADDARRIRNTAMRKLRSAEGRKEVARKFDELMERCRELEVKRAGMDT